MIPRKGAARTISRAKNRHPDVEKSSCKNMQEERA